MFRRDHACKAGREITMEHVSFRVWDRSDPYYLDLTLMERMKNRVRSPLPSIVEDMVDKNNPYYNLDKCF